MPPRTIRNCPVAVIGGAGFLGSHLVDHLIRDRGCEVTVIDNFEVGQKEFLDWQEPSLYIYKFDITKVAPTRHARSLADEWGSAYDEMVNIFKGHRIQFVFNYAAHPYIPLSFERPDLVMAVNAQGAVNVINAAQMAGCQGILQVSSAELYGRGSEGDYCVGSAASADAGFKVSERGVVEPHSTYGAAKAAIDFYVQARWREAQTPCIALRQFNCVGERETHPYVVPEIISQLGRQFNLFGARAFVSLGNNSTRDFLYAGDAVRLAVELLERGQFGEVYNLGSESAIKIYDLARLVGKVMGFNEVVVKPDPARVRPWEIWHLQSDNSKLYRAISETGKRPDDVFCQLAVTPLEEALRRTIAWYRGNGGRWPWEK